VEHGVVLGGGDAGRGVDERIEVRILAAALDRVELGTRQLEARALGERLDDAEPGLDAGDRRGLQCGEPAGGGPWPGPFGPATDQPGRQFQFEDARPLGR
jgi:hypothetical protein